MKNTKYLKKYYNEGMSIGSKYIILVSDQYQDKYGYANTKLSDICKKGNLDKLIEELLIRYFADMQTVTITGKKLLSFRAGFEQGVIFMLKYYNIIK